MEFHFYADDSQIYFSFNYSSCCLSVVSCIQACLSDISSWVSLNKWKFNGDKTELLIIGSQFRPTLQFPPVVLNDGSMNLPSKYARNIGVTFNSVLNVEHHITDIYKSWYFNMCNIYRIRQLLSTEHTNILVMPLLPQDSTIVIHYVVFLVAFYTNHNLHRIARQA